MILATPQLLPFSPLVHTDKSQHWPLYCAGFSKVEQAFSNKDKESATLNGHVHRRCECFDLYKELVPYKKSWSWQKSAVKRRHKLIDRDEDHADMLMVLQHPPVYTMGTGSLEKYLNFDIQNSPRDIYRTERGGEVTYHGPGQVTRRSRHSCPLFNFFYQGVKARGPHWSLGNQKVAAIGIRVSRWIAYHGLALNVTTDMQPFQHIVPCGIQDREVGNLRALLGRSSDGVGITGDDAVLMDAAHESLLREFSEVFQLSLEQKPINELVVLGERL